MSDSTRRRAEIEAKKAKLEELKKQRALRQRSTAGGESRTEVDLCRFSSSLFLILCQPDTKFRAT